MAEKNSGRKETITAEISRWTAGVKFSDLLPEAVHQSKRFLLDAVGCALGGAVAATAIAVIRPRLRMVAAPLVFAFTIVALLFTLHGEKAPTETLTVKVALYLSGRSTPFVRAPH